MPKLSRQDKIFLNGEGDKWFLRNKSRIKDAQFLKNDIPLELIKKSGLKPEKVLEIGCSNGYRLEEIRRLFGSECFGIEPSKKAIADGRALYPEIFLKRGIIDTIPFEDSAFDLVVINYVFHWVDRPKLLTSIKEVDRVIKNKGHLIIADFLPPHPQVVPYHHLSPGKVFTYKLNYADMFLSTGFYKLVSSVVFKHSEPNIRNVSIPGKERAGAFLIQKLLDR